MKFAPIDIRKQPFPKRMRGYDVEEVRSFLEMVAEDYEKIAQEHGMLSEKVRYLNERLEEYHNLEKTLQNSILTAEQASAESRERSRSEAQAIINDAQVRAERILEDSRSRLRMLAEQVSHLATQKDLFIQRFQGILDAQGQFLKGNQDELEAIDQLNARGRDLATHALGGFAEAPADVEAPLAAEEEVEAPTAEAEGPWRDPFHHAPLPPARAADYEDMLVPSRVEGEQEDVLNRPQERPEGFFDLNAGSNSEEGARR